jgi:hypothetical protein
VCAQQRFAALETLEYRQLQLLLLLLAVRARYFDGFVTSKKTLSVERQNDSFV